MNINHLLQLIKVRHLLLLLVIPIVTGCLPSEDEIQTVETETSIPSETAVASTSSPDSQVTIRPTSTIVVPTFTPTTVTELPTASPIPLSTATLTFEEKSEILAELMRTNGGCELPCWWGIVPGETNLEEIGTGFAERGFRVGATSIGMRGADDFGVFMEFDIEGTIIQSIHVGGDYLTDMEESSAYSHAFAQGWQPYGLEAVLSAYGAPTQVLIYSPFQADPGGGPSYHLLVFYENLGIEIEYIGSAEQLDGSRYRACPDLNDIWQIGLFLYQPSQVDNVVERVLPPESVSFIAESETVYDLISWQEATGSSLDYFHETFSTLEDACFEFSNQ